LGSGAIENTRWFTTPAKPRPLGTRRRSEERLHLNEEKAQMAQPFHALGKLVFFIPGELH